MEWESDPLGTFADKTQTHTHKLQLTRSGTFTEINLSTPSLVDLTMTFRFIDYYLEVYTQR